MLLQILVVPVVLTAAVSEHLNAADTDNDAAAAAAAAAAVCHMTVALPMHCLFLCGH